MTYQCRTLCSQHSSVQNWRGFQASSHSSTVRQPIQNSHPSLSTFLICTLFSDSIVFFNNARKSGPSRPQTPSRNDLSHRTTNQSTLSMVEREDSFYRGFIVNMSVTWMRVLSRVWFDSLILCDQSGLYI